MAQSKVQVVISVLDQYSSQLDSFSGKINTLAGGVAKLSGVFAGVGLAAGGLATKLGTDLVNTAAAVQTKLFDVAAVAKTTLGEDALKVVGGIVDDLTVRFPVMGTQAGQALEIIAQLGYGSEQQLRNLGEAAVTLGTATSRGIGQSSEILVSTLNAFNLASEDAIKVSNVFAATQFNSAAALEDLAVAFQFIGPTAQAMGKSLEETATAVALLRNVGIDASIVGTQLRMALLKLASPTKKGKEALAAMGLTMEQLNPETHNFQEIIGTLEGRLKTVAQASELFGVRAGPLMFQLVQQGSARFAELQEKITGTSAATDAAATKMQSFAGRVNFIASSLEVLKNQIGMPLLEAITDILGRTPEEGLGGFVNKLIEMEKETGAWKDTIVGAFEDLVAVAKDVFENKFKGSLEEVYNFGTQVFETLIDVVKKVAEAIGTFIQIGVDLIKWWRELNPETKESILQFGKLAAMWGPLVAGGLAFVAVLTKMAAVLIKLPIELIKTVRGMGSLGTTAASTTASVSGLSVAMKVGLVGAAGAVGVALGTLIRQIPGVDEGVQKLYKTIGLFSDEFKAQATARKQALEGESRALEIYREKWGITAKTVEEAQTKRREQLHQAAVEEEKSTRMRVAVIDDWVDSQTRIREAIEKTRTEGAKNNQVLIESFVDGARVYEDQVYKTSNALEQLSGRTRELSGQPLKLNATPAEQTLMRLSNMLNEATRDRVVHVYTEYHDAERPAAAAGGG